MFQCQDSNGKTGPCLLRGQGIRDGNDPPIEFEESHIASPAAASAAVHFFVGDTQAHSFTGSTFPQPAAITKLLGRVLLEELRRFGSASNIVWTAGNNDGPHNAIFTKPWGEDNSTTAWAQQLLHFQIVTDDLKILYHVVSPAGGGGGGGSSSHVKRANLIPLNQTTLFRMTGFYCKALPQISASAYAVVLNTNIGGANPVQLDALNTTLAWIWAKHGVYAAVYVLGHHPAVMQGGLSAVCDGMLPPGAAVATCRTMVKGVFAGHVHMAAATTSQLYTLAPAVSRYGATTGFWVGSVSESAPEFRVRTASDLFTYQDAPGQLADATKWLT